MKKLQKLDVGQDLHLKKNIGGIFIDTARDEPIFYHSTIEHLPGEEWSERRADNTVLHHVYRHRDGDKYYVVHLGGRGTGYRREISRFHFEPGYQIEVLGDEQGVVDQFAYWGIEERIEKIFPGRGLKSWMKKKGEELEKKEKIIADALKEAGME